MLICKCKQYNREINKSINIINVYKKKMKVSIKKNYISFTIKKKLRVEV